MRGDVAVLRNMKIENSIVMTTILIDYGKRITDTSLVEKSRSSATSRTYREVTN